VSQFSAQSLLIRERISDPRFVICKMEILTFVLSSSGMCHNRVRVIAQKTGAPGAIPTRDLPLRRRTLYAAELREHEPILITQITTGT
jgi:hypothetical protein